MASCHDKLARQGALSVVQFDGVVVSAACQGVVGNTKRKRHERRRSRNKRSARLGPIATGGAMRGGLVSGLACASCADARGLLVSFWNSSAPSFLPGATASTRRAMFRSMPRWLLEENEQTEFLSQRLTDAIDTTLGKHVAPATGTLTDRREEFGLVVFLLGLTAPLKSLYEIGVHRLVTQMPCANWQPFFTSKAELRACVEKRSRCFLLVGVDSAAAWSICTCTRSSLYRVGKSLSIDVPSYPEQWALLLAVVSEK